MRINDDDGKPLTSVYLALSDSEARELITALTTLQTATKGWHEHVSDAEYRCEVTVYREDDETAIFAESPQEVWRNSCGVAGPQAPRSVSGVAGTKVSEVRGPRMDATSATFERASVAWRLGRCLRSVRSRRNAHARQALGRGGRGRRRRDPVYLTLRRERYGARATEACESRVRMHRIETQGPPRQAFRYSP